MPWAIGKAGAIGYCCGIVTSSKGRQKERKEFVLITRVVSVGISVTKWGIQAVAVKVQRLGIVHNSRYPIGAHEATPTRVEESEAGIVVVSFRVPLIASELAG